MRTSVTVHPTIMMPLTFPNVLPLSIAPYTPIVLTNANMPIYLAMIPVRQNRSYIEVKFNNEVFQGCKCENKRMHCVRNVYLIKEDILGVTCLFYHCGCSPPWVIINALLQMYSPYTFEMWQQNSCLDNVRCTQPATSSLSRYINITMHM